LFCDDKVAWLFLEPATCIFEKLRAFSFSKPAVLPIGFSSFPAPVFLLASLYFSAGGAVEKNP